MLLTGWAALWLAACLCATCYSLLALDLSSWAVLRRAACLCATHYWPTELTYLPRAACRWMHTQVRPRE